MANAPSPRRKAAGAIRLRSNIDPSFFRMLGAQGDMALVEDFMRKRPSTGQRLAAGKALRQRVPRASHADYVPRKGRPDPVEPRKNG